MKIFITGATGNVGHEVILQLIGKEANILAGVRNPDKIDKKIKDVAYVAFDFLNSDTYGPALSGVDTLFLMRPPAISNIKRDMAPFLNALPSYGIKRIVFLSLLGVEKNTFVPHHAIEKIIKNLSIPYTFLRAGFFMQNLTTLHLEDISKKSYLYLPAGKGKTSFVDVRDIASIAGNSLMKITLQNEIFDITGTEALSYYEVANCLSEVLQKNIEYRPASLPGFFLHLKRQGYPIPYILVVYILYSFTRWGKAAYIARETTSILGRPPIRLRQFIEDHKFQLKGEKFE